MSTVKNVNINGTVSKLSAGVYDVTEQNNGKHYSGISDVLSQANTDIPINDRFPGMQIKFIQTTSAKYAVVKTDGVVEQPIGTEIQSNPGVDSGTYEESQLSVAFSSLPDVLNSSITYYLTVTETTTYTTWKITLVQSSDNSYVQYRYISSMLSTSDFTKEKNWQGVDDVPTTNSKNLPNSDGTYSYICNQNRDTNIIQKATILSNGSIYKGYSDLFSVSDYFLAISGAKIINGRKTGIVDGSNYMMCAFYDENLNFISGIVSQNQTSYRFNLELTNENIPSGAVWFRANLDGSSGLILNTYKRSDSENFTFLKSTLKGLGVFNNDGTVHNSSSYPCISEYFYASVGSYICGLFAYSSSYLTNIVFYDANLNVLSVLQKTDGTNLFLTEDDIPSDAVYFRACVNKNDGYVVGNIAGTKAVEHNNTVSKLVLPKHYAIASGMGGIANDGSLVRSSVERITDYFYAHPGSVVNRPFYAASAPSNVVFYDYYLNPIATITGYQNKMLVLNSTNIPSSAVYFRAALKPNNDDSYVQGIVAEGLEDRAFTKRQICLYHEFGKIPELVKGTSHESIKLIYPSVRIFIQDNYSEYYYKEGSSGSSGVTSITVNAGEIEIPRYGALYIDITNRRYAVSSTSYTVIDIETGYDLVNGVAYYDKKNLQKGQFLQVLKVGANCAVNGILLDSIIDARIRNIEENIINIGLGGIYGFNPSSDYDALMQSAKCPSFIRSTKTNVTPSPTSLLWFSDIHAGIDALKNVLLWENKYSNFIDDIIATGDQQNLYFSDDYNWWNVNGASSVLQVIGNHDAWISKAMHDTGDYDEITERQYGSSDFYIIKQKPVYDKFIAPFINSWQNVIQPQNAESLGKCYYYKDYDAIRLIVIDCMHYGSPDDLDGNNQSIQDAWLQSVLADAVTNNKPVVIASHFYPGFVENINCNYSEMFQGSGDDKLNSLAFNSVDAFISNGGEFVTWIVGHTHADNIGLLKSSSGGAVLVRNQLVINITTANVARATYTPRIRFANTKTADAINFICFDTVRKIVKIVRIGSDTTDLMNRYRKTIYRYADTTEGSRGLVVCE